MGGQGPGAGRRGALAGRLGYAGRVTRSGLAVMALALLACGRRNFNTPDASPTVDAAAACPVSYVLSPSTGIHYSVAVPGRLVTWSAARTACLQDGQQLAQPLTNLEALTLADQADGAEVWVDISTVSTPGVWSDRDGQAVTFLPWATGWPDGSGDCVRMSFEAEMRDTICVAGYAYVCECRGP